MDIHGRKFLEMLEEITKGTFEDPKKLDYHLGIYDLAEAELKMNGIEAPFVFTVLRQNALSNYMEFSKITEFDVHNWFKNNYQKILNGYFLVEKKSESKHIPDFWLMNNNELIPVEIKLEKFDSKALKQLRRYMNHYGCKTGIAVGRELTCELPSYIKFLPYDKNEVKEWI